MSERGKEPPEKSSSRESSGVPSITCPHCAGADLVQIRASEIVTIYKCPVCGGLVAPVKRQPG